MEHLTSTHADARSWPSGLTTNESANMTDIRVHCTNTPIPKALRALLRRREKERLDAALAHWIPITSAHL